MSELGLTQHDNKKCVYIEPIFMLEPLNREN
jgi:hypothetical protein